MSLLCCPPVTYVGPAEDRNPEYCDIGRCLVPAMKCLLSLGGWKHSEEKCRKCNQSPASAISRDGHNLTFLVEIVFSLPLYYTGMHTNVKQMIETFCSIRVEMRYHIWKSVVLER